MTAATLGQVTIQAWNQEFNSPLDCPVTETVVKDPRAKQLGEWLSEWRRKRGLSRPEMVAEALKHDPRASISADYLSKLEYGVRNLASASMANREALRLALGIQGEIWQAETGLLVPAIPGRLAVPDLPYPARPHFYPPETLLEAARVYGNRFPDLLNESWQKYLLTFKARGARADSPEEWLDLYRDLAKHGITPGGN